MNLKQLRDKIDFIELALRDELVDLLEIAEAKAVRFDDWTEDDEGNPVGVLYPENVAPNLDMAIHHMHCAWMELTNHLDELESNT